jgi:hypothetical protein
MLVTSSLSVPFERSGTKCHLRTCWKVTVSFAFHVIFTFVWCSLKKGHIINYKNNKCITLNLYCQTSFKISLVPENIWTHLYKFWCHIMWTQLKLFDICPIKEIDFYVHWNWCLFPHRKWLGCARKTHFLQRNNCT